MLRDVDCEGRDEDDSLPQIFSRFSWHENDCVGSPISATFTGFFLGHVLEGTELVKLAQRFWAQLLILPTGFGKGLAA